MSNFRGESEVSLFFVARGLDLYNAGEARICNSADFLGPDVPLPNLDLTNYCPNCGGKTKKILSPAEFSVYESSGNLCLRRCVIAEKLQVQKDPF